ncbi:hypothetical protein POM88_007787 [Heracleum sosnowskyi]|uniref:Uncharacterized protein n=1 Tax=Heracleum sosnowskyi TaxID=360622 RepID=A0AAD8N5W0_9APIA|nr:hypothetical protein POM88_007787 [Heracleum sosnowskyi]
MAIGKAYIHCPFNGYDNCSIEGKGSSVQPRVLDASILDKVFQCSFCTVKIIPPSCRLAFSGALKATLSMIVSNPSSCDAWVQLLILPACTLRIFTPRDRQERRSGNKNALQQKHILSALTSWGES